MEAMVVDDSRAMRSMIAGILRELGFDVLQACDGCDDLSKLQESRCPNLALVDWNMPNMDGLQFVREVRENSAWDSLTLMMVTAETESAQVVNAIEAGANEYLMKPFTREALAEKIQLLGIR